MKAFFRPALLSCLLVLSYSFAGAGEWSSLITVRFGNIDAIDAEDGELARFVKNIRNDGRFPPPMRTLVGPEILNPTFYGVIFEAWIECLTLVPPEPGYPRTVWAIPVDNREEYLTFMTSQGLSEYEGMDGVTILREMGADGSVKSWYLQWLPGNIAVFGVDRDAVMAAQRIYIDRSASRGLLYGAEGRFVNPDVTVRFDLPAIAVWQDREPGSYWWREKIDSLANDILALWDPDSARQKLLWSMADAFTVWPRSVSRFDMSFWFEDDGIQCRLEVDGEHRLPQAAQLSCLRKVPDRTALATAVPVTPASFAEQADWMGDLLLAAAGGVVTREVRDAAIALRRLAADGGIREMVTALVPPPKGTPDLGGVRLVVMDWQIPEQADRVWDRLRILLGSDPAMTRAFTQMGLTVQTEEAQSYPGTLGVTVTPAGSELEKPYYRATWTFRREGNIIVLVIGTDREDDSERIKVRRYRTELAAEVARSHGEGGSDVRDTFTRMGPNGSSWLGFFEPVRFMQFCFIESADWRPRSPDQLEPQSTQLARETLEYSPGRAWTVSGESQVRQRRFDGVLSWDSLTRLAGALGLTESIGM